MRVKNQMSKDTTHGPHQNGDFSPPLMTCLTSPTLVLCHSSYLLIFLYKSALVLYGKWIVILMIFVSAMARLFKVWASDSGSCHAFPGNWVPACFIDIMYLKSLAIRHTRKRKKGLGKGLARCSIHMQRENTCWEVPSGSFLKHSTGGYKHYTTLKYFKIYSLDFFKSTWSKLRVWCILYTF